MKLKDKIKRELLKKRAQMTRLVPIYNPQSLNISDEPPPPHYVGSDPIGNILRIIRESKTKEGYRKNLKYTTNLLERAGKYIRFRSTPPRPYTHVSLANAYDYFLGIPSEKILRKRIKALEEPLKLDWSKINKKFPVAFLPAWGDAGGLWDPSLGTIFLILDEPTENAIKGETLLHELVHAVQTDATKNSKIVKEIINATPWYTINDRFEEILFRTGHIDDIKNDSARDLMEYMKRPTEFFNNLAMFTRRYVIENKRFPKDADELKDYVYKNFTKNVKNVTDDNKVTIYRALVFMHLYNSKNEKIRKLFRNIVNNLVMNDRQKLEKIRGIA